MSVGTVTPPPSRAKGMFEIFATGLFVVAHLGLLVGVFAFPTGLPPIEQAWSSTIALIIAVITTSFSYLTGALLRTIRCDTADKLSGLYRRIARTIKWHFGRIVGNERGRKLLVHPTWDTEDFPYIGFIGEQCQRYLSKSAQEFYRTTWQPRRLGENNRAYFNFCKNLLAKIDAGSAAEAFAAEALSRYLAQMLYALSLSVLIVILVLCLGDIRPYQGIAWLLLGAYSVMIAVILKNYRFVRTKEVEVLFAMCFANRTAFENLEKANTDSA